MLVELSLKSPDLDFDINFDLASFVLHFCLVFKLRGSFPTFYLLYVEVAEKEASGDGSTWTGWAVTSITSRFYQQKQETQNSVLSQQNNDIESDSSGKGMFCLFLEYSNFETCQFNLLQPSVSFDIETIHLFYKAIQITGFYMKHDTGLKSVNLLFRYLLSSKCYFFC